jgi:hypothetical protein
MVLDNDPCAYLVRYMSTFLHYNLFNSTNTKDYYKFQIATSIVLFFHESLKQVAAQSILFS